MKRFINLLRRLTGRPTPDKNTVKLALRLNPDENGNVWIAPDTYIHIDTLLTALQADQKMATFCYEFFRRPLWSIREIRNCPECEEHDLD